MPASRADWPGSFYQRPVTVGFVVPNLALRDQRGVEFAIVDAQVHDFIAFK